MKDRITKVISDAKITKTEFAKRINVSQAFVSQMCSGTANPSDRTISDICRIFDIQEDWLRHGLEPMRSPKSREEEIAELVGSALVGSNDFKKAVIRMICSRTDDELVALEAALRAIYEECLKQKEPGN